MIGKVEARQAIPGPTGASPARVEWLLLGLLVLAAFAIRVYRLGTFPDTVLADEADNAQSAIRILFGQHPENGIFGLDWTSQPAFSVYKEAAFIALLGFNIAAMRLPSALISSLALIPFYLLLRRQLSIVASLLATVLLATDVWYLNFSRSGWNCIDASFYMLMAMLFLMLALDALESESAGRWRKWIYFGSAGFFCAMGLYGYPAGRAITVAVAVFLPVALFFYRRQRRGVLQGYLLLFAVEALAFLPQGIYVARHWDFFNGRTQVVSIFSQPDFKADPVGTMLNQLGRNIRGPWDGSVNNTAQYSPVHEAQLDRVTGLLTLLGMLLTLALGSLRRRPETWLWWLMLLAGWGFTQLLTVSTPNGARGIGYMPTLVYFAGISLDQVVQGVGRLTTRKSAPSDGAQPARRTATAALVVAILFAGFANIKHYADWQSWPRTRQDRYLYITAQEFPAWAATIAFRAQNGLGVLNVGEWRDAYPVQDIANPDSTLP